jgi:hypothetical protein
MQFPVDLLGAEVFFRMEAFTGGLAEMGFALAGGGGTLFAVTGDEDAGEG